MRKTPVAIVVQSHLSDSLIERRTDPELADQRIHFVKLLLHKYPDLETGVTDEELSQLWQDHHPELFPNGRKD